VPARSDPLDGVLLSTLASEPAQLLGVAARALKVGADVASIDGMKAFGPAFFSGESDDDGARRMWCWPRARTARTSTSGPDLRPARVSGTIVGSPGGIHANAIRLRPTGEVAVCGRHD
jgi:hypothetical protein